LGISKHPTPHILAVVHQQKLTMRIQENKMKLNKNGLIDDKYELVVKEFQTFLSVFYLILVGIGMLFSYMKYSRFGINIFQYSDIFDFLLTPFRDLSIFIFSLISISLVFFIYKVDKFTKKKFPKYYKSKYHFGLMKSQPIIGLVIAFILYLFIFSGKYGEYREKRILRNPKSIEIVLNNGETKNGNLIGKNNGYVFLLENDNEVNIYPITNLTEIKMK